MGKNSMRRDMSKIVLKDMFNLSDDEWTVWFAELFLIPGLDQWMLV